MVLIRVYADVSAQEINMTKSKVFFGRNISRPPKEYLARVMGLCQVLGMGTYLGLPSMIGKSKKRILLILLRIKFGRDLIRGGYVFYLRYGKRIMIK